MYVHKKYMPHNYCYHSKKSKLIYFEFSSHCLVWLASRLASLHRAEPSLIFWLAKIASRAELGSFSPSLSGNWFHKTNDLVWFETLIILSGCCVRPSTGLTSRAHFALSVDFHLPLHLWWGAVILFSYTM